MQPYYEKDGVSIYQGNCLDLLDDINSIDSIITDPPYFLSNDGISCKGGEIVSVNKGDWDKSQGVEADHEFNLQWLNKCRNSLKKDGTIWISGTHHVIHSIGFAMQKLGFKLLNDITWIKFNPPPNLSCRYFTHATETIIWAAREKESHHTYNYELMKQQAGNKQMRSDWSINTPLSSEKQNKHPTQKPLALIERMILASTQEKDLILDPFMGSGTTLIAAKSLGCRAIGIELNEQYCEIAAIRLSGEIVPKRWEKKSEKLPEWWSR